MKRLAVFLSLLGAVSLILATSNFESNAALRTGQLLAQGGGQPVPPKGIAHPRPVPPHMRAASLA